MIETRTFKELWNSGVIDQDRFRRYTRMKGIPDSTIRNWVSGPKKPCSGNMAIVMAALASQNINIKDGRFLFNK